MRAVCAAGFVGLLTVSVAAGQSAPAAAKFEVADVRPSASTPNQAPLLVTAPRDGRYRIRRATMVDLIRTAYSVDADKVVGGPHWLELDRFDIIAKVPANATRESVKPMLQALLADRFGLVLTQEVKPVAANVLVRSGEALKVKESSTTGSCQQQIVSGSGVPLVTMTCRGVTMTAFAEQLKNMAPLLGITGSVVDGTGVSGPLDFELRFSPISLTALANANVAIAGMVPLRDALDKQLGVKLEAKSVPLPAVTVQTVNRTPTPNDAAAVAAALPPAPPLEFEVATIKKSAPGGRPNLQTLPNGQINFSAIPLRVLVGIAWEVTGPASSIVGSDKLDSALFDVIGKVSTGPIDPQQIDREEIGAMLRKLVLDQLNLKVRTENRPVTGHSLVLNGNHKLTKADPAARTRCVDGALQAQGSSSGPRVPGRTVTCQNMTMGEFAARLQQLSGGFFQAPVLDETGLEGRWNFAITFAPQTLIQAIGGARGGLPPGGGLAASEPTGAMTIEEAIERQMGLKLKTQQRTAPVLVVDYVEEQN